MAETDWSSNWDWDLKSEDYIEGYVLGSQAFVYFINGYNMDIINGECIYYFEEEE